MTEEQKKVMRTQDIKYVETKRIAEAKVKLSFSMLNSLMQLWVKTKSHGYL